MPRARSKVGKEVELESSPARAGAGEQAPTTKAMGAFVVDDQAAAWLLNGATRLIAEQSYAPKSSRPG
jgi:hypothetical protein